MDFYARVMCGSCFSWNRRVGCVNLFTHRLVTGNGAWHSHTPYMTAFLGFQAAVGNGNRLGSLKNHFIKFFNAKRTPSLTSTSAAMPLVAARASRSL